MRFWCQRPSPGKHETAPPSGGRVGVTCPELSPPPGASAQPLLTVGAGTCVQDTLLSAQCWPWPREVCQCLPCPPQSQQSDEGTRHVPGREGQREDGVTWPSHGDHLSAAAVSLPQSGPPS